MKILFVNQTFYPDPVATAQHLSDLALTLKKQGHDVTVLTSQRGYSEPHPRYSAQENYNGIQVVRVWQFALGREKKLFRLIDAICINLAFFWRFLLFSRFDRVVVLTSPPLVAFLIQIGCVIKKSPLIYWVMDMNPHEAIAIGWISEKSIMAKLLKWCQSVVIRRSSKVIVLDKYMRAKVLEAGARAKHDFQGGGDKKDGNKIAIIAPWAHDEDLCGADPNKNTFRGKYGIESKFVVMYSGNHSICHPLDTVLSAAKILASDESIVFMFIGGGARVSDVTDFKRNHRLDNIMQLNYMERSELKYSLSAANLHVVVMGENMVGVVHPCKVYGVLMLGLPFVGIGPSESHIEDLMMSGVQGYSIRHGQPDKLVDVIQRVKRLEVSELKSISQTNRFIANQFSAKTLIPRLVNEILEAP